MQVFKLYWKICRKYIGQIFMYVGIFSGVVLGAVLPAQYKEAQKQYEESRCDFAVFDYDNSEVSQELVAYLEMKHNVKDIGGDTTETVQDALYNKEVDCIVRINPGYGERFLAGDAGGKLEIVQVPGTITSTLFEQDLNSFLKIAETYMDAGYSVEEAFAQAKEVEELSVEMSIPQGTNVSTTKIYIYLKYLVWILVMALTQSIAPVLIVMNQKGAREKIACSPYKFGRMNWEILLGVMVTSVGVCLLFVFLGMTAIQYNFFTVTGLLHIVNLLCYAMFALALTFLISKLVDTTETAVISLAGNIVSLGMSFLCGVFVPQEVLSDSVLKIAHFLPGYWYLDALKTIEQYGFDKIGSIVPSMGIQLLFAAALIVVAMIISNKKRVAA